MFFLAGEFFISRKYWENTNNRTLNNIIKGYETSSTTLTYCMYELSVNEDIQKKVRESVQNVMKKHGNKLSYESIGEMDYLEQCINGKRLLCFQNKTLHLLFIPSQRH